MQDPFVGHGQVKAHSFFSATPTRVHEPLAGPPASGVYVADFGTNTVSVLTN